MEPLSTLAQIYLVCGAIGSIYLIGSFALGAIDSGGDAGHGDIDHGAHVDAGDGAHVDAGDGGADAQLSDGAHGESGSHGNGHSQLAHHQLTAHTPPLYLALQSAFHPRRMVLSLLTPMSFASFIAFFGIIGFMTLHAFPFLGPISLAPAIATGLVLCGLMRLVMFTIFSRLTSSSHISSNQMIGHMADVITPVEAGRTGEIIYVISGQRYNSPAKAATPEMSFPRGSKVIITDMQGRTALIEQVSDPFLLESTNSNHESPDQHN